MSQDKEIKFYRGLKEKYSEVDHKDALYFATDKKEIILTTIRLTV